MAASRGLISLARWPAGLLSFFALLLLPLTGGFDYRRSLAQGAFGHGRSRHRGRSGALGPRGFRRRGRGANARLIAAAPEMLSLLAEAISRVDDLVRALGKAHVEVEDLAAWSDDARDILARVGGERT